MICKEVNNWRCVKCTVAAHTKCSPWEEHVLTLEGGKQAVCWRHPSNWLLQNEVYSVLCFHCFYISSYKPIGTLLVLYTILGGKS
jgi:hypothetical protein